MSNCKVAHGAIDRTRCDNVWQLTTPLVSLWGHSLERVELKDHSDQHSKNDSKGVSSTKKGIA